MGNENESKLDKPLEPGEQLTGSSALATEAQDPTANRAAAGAEEQRRHSTTVELPKIELVADKPAEKPKEPAKPPEKPVDRNEMEKAADAIEEACNGGWLGGAGTDKKTIYGVLEGKSEAERKLMDQIFREKYGKKYGAKGDGSDWGLAEEFADEMSGADLDKAMNLLNKKDGKADDAGRIHTALIERNQYFEGRSNAICEKDIRDTIATMNSKQIADLEKEYAGRYEQTLRTALINDANLDKGTKEALEIYLKGTDNRTADDTLKLANIAIGEKNIDMFEEAMRDASPAARQRFMGGDGEKRMKDAFGGIFSDTDFYHAKEYAEKGSLTTATKIRDNTSWAGDNEKAIEQSIAEMTAEQRKAYLDGRNIASGKDAPALTAEQKAEALKAYQEIHSALEGAGNENELAKWEDQIAVKGGSLVTRLAMHRGSIYDDSMHDVLTTIEDMPEADWKRLKSDPEFRAEVEHALGTYLSDDEMKRARDVLDAKQKAETFQEATASGRRPILDAIADNVGFFNNKETHIYEVIEKMTPEEQRQYRDDAQFRKKLDAAVNGALDQGAERDTAFGMLEKVAKGEKPTRGIIEKLNEQAADINTDEAAVIRDLRKAFAEDPTLRERIIHPQTAEDRLMATKFDNAIHRALDQDEYDRYAKPLLETGHLSLEVQLELDKGVFNDDEQGVYKDVLAVATDQNPAAQAERQKILTDKEYQDKVFSFLSDEERKVALNALAQGKMQPEDVIRSHMLGAGTDETEIKEALAGLNQDEIKQLRQDYARKYGEDLTYSLLDEMGGQDAIDVTRATRAQPTTDRQAYNLARDELYERRDGIGKAWVDNAWDGSGYMTDDTANKFAAAMSRSSAEFRDLSPEQQKALTEQIQKNLDMFAESKGAAADMAVDAVIIAAAVAGAKFTGGVSLALLTKTALLGAAFKVAAKSSIMGADYDWASSQVVTDSLTGAVDAASIVIGPAQLAQVFKMGEQAASVATGKLLSEGGEQLLKAGAEKQVGQKMFELVASTISNGAEAVDDKAIKALAKELAREGQEGALEAAIKQNLKEAMEQEARSAVKRTVEEMSLNMGAGAAGGGASAGIRSVAEWDAAVSVSENLQRVAEATVLGAGMGAGMAGTFSLAFKGLGKSWEAIRGASKEAPPVHPDLDVVVNGQHVSANQKVVSFRADGSPATTADTGAKLQVSFARDEDGHMLMLDHSEAGTWVKRAGSDQYERIPFGEPVPVKPGDEVRLGSETGPKLDLGQVKKPAPVARAGNEGAPTGDSAHRSTDAADRRFADEPVGARHRGDGPAGSRPLGGHDLQAGEKVHYDGQDHMLVGFDHNSGEAIIADQSRANYAGMFRKVGKDELARDFSKVQVEDHTYFRGKDGTFYSVRPAADGTNMMYPKHDLVAVPREKLERVAPMDSKRTLYALKLPDRAGFNLGNKELDLAIGDEVRLGRDVQGLTDSKVSRNHAVVGRDSQGLYIKDEGSRNGTYIKRHGTESFQKIKTGEKVQIHPGDDVRLGGADGPKLEGLRFPEGQLEALESLRPAKVFEQNQGRVEIGRSHVLPDGRPLRDHIYVSRNHGEMRWDEKEKAFFFTDHSAYGTWVQRDGTEGWTHVKDQEVRLGPNDKIRLGAEDGPEVPVSAFRRPEIAPFGRAEDAQIYLGDNKLSLKEGSIEIGRGHGQPIADTRVSRDHGTLRFDEADKSFYYRDHSGNGSYVRREGSNDFEFVDNKEVKLGPRDEVRLGSVDGPRLDLVAKSQSEVVTSAEKALGRQVFLNGQPVDVSSGGWHTIGRDSIPGGSQHDHLDMVASRQHAKIRMDEATGQIHLIDTSENGTWIRPAGSDQWVVANNMEVVINPGDEVRLGSQYGPELKLSHVRGEIQPDGSVYFRRPDGDFWRNSDGTTVSSDRAGIHRWSDVQGRITEIRDPSGNYRQYQYNADGSLKRVEFPDKSVMESPNGTDWTTTGPDGKKTTSGGRMDVEPDGSLRAQGADDSAKVYKLDGTVEVHRPNGRIEYSDASIKVERQRLSSLSDAHFATAEQKGRVQQLMQEFETSAKQRGVSEQEIAMTYHHINRLLQGGADAPLSQAERIRLTEQILHQVAYPQSIDQGFNSTCNVTTVEKRIFARDPAEATRLITDVATTGKYVTKDGTVIDMGRVPGALSPDKEAQIALSKPFSSDGSDIKVNRRRTFASQIFEMTAVNIKWAQSGEYSLKPGEVLHYEKPFDRLGEDSGERLFKYSVGADGQLKRVQLDDSPRIWEWELTDIHNQITGGDDSKFVIYGPTRGASDRTGTAVKVNSAQELERQLIDLYKHKDFPAVLTVHTSQPPFRGIDDPAAGGNGGWHVINIQNIHRGKSGKVYVEFTNQWGSAKNHMGKKAVAVDVLFQATQKAAK